MQILSRLMGAVGASLLLSAVVCATVCECAACGFILLAGWTFHRKNCSTLGLGTGLRVGAWFVRLATQNPKSLNRKKDPPRD